MTPLDIWRHIFRRTIKRMIKYISLTYKYRVEWYTCVWSYLLFLRIVLHERFSKKDPIQHKSHYAYRKGCIKHECHMNDLYWIHVYLFSVTLGKKRLRMFSLSNLFVNRSRYHIILLQKHYCGLKFWCARRP